MKVLPKREARHPCDTPISVDDVWCDVYDRYMLKIGVVSPFGKLRWSVYMVKMLPKSETLQVRHTDFCHEHLRGLSVKDVRDDM